VVDRVVAYFPLNSGGTDEVGELAEEAVGWFVVADKFDAGYLGTGGLCRGGKGGGAVQEAFVLHVHEEAEV
jgi:hypothetical protein